MTVNCFSSTESPIVLCIDDDPDISATIAARLQQYDVDVLRAYHGMHGLWLARTQNPDLVITDINMPQGAGDYIVDRLRSCPATKSIPIIVLTGLQGPWSKSVALRQGIETLLVKPVQFAELARAIKKFIPLNQRKLNEATVEF
jgi:DNA-binding response OmpR family regulator